MPGSVLQRWTHHDQAPETTSPLRQNSSASTASTVYSQYSNAPSRSSTVSSAASSAYLAGVGHKRGLSETSPTRTGSNDANVRESGRLEGAIKRNQASKLNPSISKNDAVTARHHTTMTHGSAASKHISPRQHLRSADTLRHNEAISLSEYERLQPSNAMLQRAGSVRVGHRGPESTPDLSTLQKSTTSHFRTLSKLAPEDVEQSQGPEVIGMCGRRQLKRSESVRPKNAWTESNWMEKQRQFLQAYEYLCHIGEAKEWIEDVIQQTLPPIVLLEEALRDGVTLAEIVQSVCPRKAMRIFRHPKLQYRHSDNIALFFQFLHDIELPELFHFELIDLYEKKNIPKVIYCIHALSWLLFRKGLVNFKIGNLVGQLEFEHHELEEMQKGLDKSGVSMPSFAGMGASFGSEPVKTETQRLDEHNEQICDLQSQIRASLVRIDLGNDMQRLWVAESQITNLQSLVRARWGREVAEYKLTMHQSTLQVQSAVRGFLMRRWHEEASQPDPRMLQSLLRAHSARNHISGTRSNLRRNATQLINMQASIRGAVLRKQLEDQQQESRDFDPASLQAIFRGRLTRDTFLSQSDRLRRAEESIVHLQARLRAKQTRTIFIRRTSIFRAFDCQSLQAKSRGFLSRWRQGQLLLSLANGMAASRLHEYIKGGLLRSRVYATLSALDDPQRLQAHIRGSLQRSQLQAEQDLLESQEKSNICCQSLIRGAGSRSIRHLTLKSLAKCNSRVIRLQALSRAMLLRLDVGELLSYLDDEEDSIVLAQAASRAALVRVRFADKQRFYQKNMEKVVKVQSFVRAKIQGEAYKSLTNGKNPPVGTVKNFVHLLNDSDFDFDEEVEFERLRKTVVQHVRQNEMADQYIAQLDIKIALLVKNKITLDEVVKHQKHFGTPAGSLLTAQDAGGIDLKALNKTSRQKLERYQELFFILQTQPQYLARLFRRFRGDKDCERMKYLMMGVFGYAQKRREEYYLLRLIARSMREEIDNCTTIQEYSRGAPFWSKLFAAYIKSPRDRKYMRDLLGSIFRESIIENAELNLESDPMQIYLSLMEDEELRTGKRSQRNADIPREAAIRDPETKRAFVNHLQDLRDIADQVFLSLDEQLHKMPYGVRYIAQQMSQSLAKRFPYEKQDQVLLIVGQWVWRNYLEPALNDAEKFGVVDRGLSPEHRRNIREVSKLLGQVASGRLFGGDNVFLQPLNAYVEESIERVMETWTNLIDVPPAEAQFDIDEFNDLYSRTKPTLYIKMADIIAVHHLIASEVASICPHRDDLLQEVISELGNAKHNETELRGGTDKLMADPEADVKALMTETKRCILYIIRIQSGQSLLEIMVKPITIEDEDRWANLIHEEMSAESQSRGAYAEANVVTDIAAMSYAELKRTALENIVQLEEMRRVTRHNHYQDLLNAIAVDIRSKHRRRLQRQRELDSVRLTLARLNDQAVFLEGQLKTYNDYIEQAMMTLQNKKGKKRFVMPFTKQWDHERELARSGRVPKFGSFKYSAHDLANRGVLLSWGGYSDRQYQQLDLTVSSNEVGIFTLEGSSGSIAIPGASAQVPLDDLLQAQYNNQQVLEFFDGGEVSVNVNLFLHLIMRKFYKDKE